MMMKRFTALLLCALCLSGLFAAAHADTVDPTQHNSEPIYTARSSVQVRLLAEPDTDAVSLLSIPKGRRFNVYWVDPTWVEVEYDKKRGYIRRSCIEAVRVIDIVTTPPYGVEEFLYTAAVNGTAPVMSEKGAGDTLVTLYDGAKVALIGFEDGYGKVIYHRQYAYIDSNLLRDVAMVDRALEDPSTGEPIAAYVSFYNIAQTEANLGRMVNLQVACDRMRPIVLNTGNKLDFNKDVGPYNAASGYQAAPILADGTTKLGYGGGTCQVSSTLYNTVLQLPGVAVLKRRAHGPSGASYLPHGVDAAVGNSALNFIMRNDYEYPIRIDGSAQDGALFMAIYRVTEE